MKNNVSVSYWLKKTTKFSVEVKAFYDGNKWGWCVYAHVFENHSKFNDNDFLMNIPMHGGVTFDQQKVVQSIGGPQYSFQKTRMAKTVGCDFAHLHDDYENHPSPTDYEFGFIPEPFYSEAISILKQIEEK
jgi:hypothetical protein